VRELDARAGDLEFLRRAQRGDAKAFHALVDRHAPRLYRLAAKLLGNAVDAEDVLQETFVGAFRGLGKFQEKASLKTWLTRILVVQAAKWRRDQRRPIRQTAQLGNELSVAGAEAGVERKIDLMQALGQLSPEHREVLVLREFERLTYEEMAAVLSVPRGTIESRLHRARAELREKLKAYLP
jgi:RNA polymerase sigma-70 factor (ECF subfamily)